MTAKAEDGRVARGLRTREAVIDALFELHAEGNLTPTIEQIAERVGRTTRAIYQHFQDKEALAVAMADRQFSPSVLVLSRSIQTTVFQVLLLK